MMRIERLIIFLLVCAASTAFCQDNDFIVKDIHDPAILRTLFDAVTIDKGGAALWRPNFAEFYQFNVSNDNLCHTFFDTVIQYQSGGKLTDVVVFATYGYDETNQRINCHACAPDISVAIFTKQKKGWHFERMKKYLTRLGNFGVIQDVALRKIGDGYYALELNGGGTGQGYTVSRVTFYELDSFEDIFSTFTHEDNFGATDDTTQQYSWDKKITFGPKKNSDGFYNMVVNGSGKRHKDADNIDSPLVKYTETMTYHFDYVLLRYVCGK